jgi:hypothetical protein
MLQTLSVWFQQWNCCVAGARALADDSFHSLLVTTIMDIMYHLLCQPTRLVPCSTLHCCCTCGGGSAWYWHYWVGAFLSVVLPITLVTIHHKWTNTLSRASPRSVNCRLTEEVAGLCDLDILGLGGLLDHSCSLKAWGRGSLSVLCIN